MASDQVDIYQRAFDSESIRLRQVEAERDNRVQRQKMMLDLIREQTPLAPEDARDLANLGELDVTQRATFLSRAFAKYPTTFFPRVVDELGRIDMQKKQQEHYLSMKTLENIVRRGNEQFDRELETPTPEQYQAEYGAIAKAGGVEPIPFTGQTRTELNRQYSTMFQGQRSTTGGRTSPLDQPAGADFVEATLRAEGREPPEGVNWQEWTHRELGRYVNATPALPRGGAGSGAGAGGPAALTPNQMIQSHDEIKRYTLGQVWPELHPADAKVRKNRKYGPERTALADAIAARAIREGGDVQANADRIASEYGVTAETDGGEAIEIMKKIKAAKATAPGDAAEKIRKALRGE